MAEMEYNMYNIMTIAFIACNKCYFLSLTMSNFESVRELFYKSI